MTGRSAAFARLRMIEAITIAAGAGLLLHSADLMRQDQRNAPAALSSRLESIRARHLPNIVLTDQNGRSVRFYDDLVKGQVVALNFMFSTCRNACPVSTSNIAEVQRSLAERQAGLVRFLSVSLMPEFDTPRVLADYANAHGAGPGWSFLTGRRDEIEKLRRSVGAYDLDPAVDQDPTQHTGLLVFGNEATGRWKAISLLSHPVRIRQAIERVMLPVTQWPTGDTVIKEVPFEDSAASRQLVELLPGPIERQLAPARSD